jgi:hypothetical protein
VSLATRSFEPCESIRGDGDSLGIFCPLIAARGNWTGFNDALLMLEGVVCLRSRISLERRNETQRTVNIAVQSFAILMAPIGYFLCYGSLSVESYPEQVLEPQAYFYLCDPQT